jgi:hypothetical protein
MMDGLFLGNGLRRPCSRSPIILALRATKRKKMKQFNERWKTRLEQIELWLVSYRIEID